ncbi:MAG: SUF system NifU family Fe-S cluster assembly protein [Oligoflexia bacterium]|nr:SUF system NifU family Fe-S cluster assembly protein [Oligoflexia bacterium]
MDTDALYQEVILDHYKHPRCKGCLSTPSDSFVLYNPLCGDQVELSLTAQDDRVSEIAFNGHGCSISQASASIMSNLCRNHSFAEVREIVESFRAMMRGEVEPAALQDKLGDAVALEGVRKFSARVRCAMLAWEALEKCLGSAARRSVKDRSAKS